MKIKNLLENDLLIEDQKEPDPTFITEDGEKIWYLNNMWYLLSGGHYRSATFIANSYIKSTDKFMSMVQHYGAKHLRALVKNGYLMFEHDLDQGRWAPVKTMFDGKPVTFQIPCSNKWSPDYATLVLINNSQRNFSIISTGKVEPFKQ